jgi:hypothetical protein
MCSQLESHVPAYQHHKTATFSTALTEMLTLHARGFTQDPARAQYLVREALQAFMSLGGVRIESNVLVTADGRCGLWTAAAQQSRTAL